LYISQILIDCRAYKGINKKLNRAPPKKFGGEMNVNKILAALRQERGQIEEVIVSLELLALRRGRLRGRPPAILAAAAKKRGRPKGSKNKATVARAKAEAMASAIHAPERAMAAGQSILPEEMAGS
jgi:hypothetical protein